MEWWCVILLEMSIFCIDDGLLSIVCIGTRGGNDDKQHVEFQGGVCRLMNTKKEDDYNGVSVDNCIDILGIVMVLVRLWYGCCYSWDCNAGK
jgi:hypothetical protein